MRPGRCPPNRSAPSATGAADGGTLATAGIALLTLLIVGGAVFAGLVVFRGTGQTGRPPVAGIPECRRQPDRRERGLVDRPEYRRTTAGAGADAPRTC